MTIISDGMGSLAEKAVHMSGALTDRKNESQIKNAVTPLLETVCANRLDDSLHPAFRQIINWLAVIKPNPFASMIGLVDEVYLIMSSLLHYHYLQDSKGGGSFGEAFYGLARNKMDGRQINESDRVKSLLWLTAVPYVCTKLASKLDRYRLQLADGVLFNDLERRSKQLTCWLCGVANAILSCVKVFELTSGGGTPQLHLQRLTLQPLSIQSEPSVAIQAFAFAAQLATSIGAQNSGVQELVGMRMVPPPDYDGRCTDYLGRCALCLVKPPVSPTAVATSGYVFCFSCIMHHVQANKNGKCPVTNVPISLQHLVRIYQTSSIS